MRYLHITLLILLFAGCEEYYVPDLDDVQPIYAFEGNVTDQPGPYRVKVSKANGYNSQPAVEIITDAIVSIQCNNGKCYNLKYDTTGYYLSDSLDFTGKIGSMYRLIVTMPDGKVFESTNETITKCADIEALSARYYEKWHVTSDGIYYNDELEKGLQITNTTNAKGCSFYYRYDCQFSIQTHQTYDITPNIIHRYIYRPMSSKGQLYISNANDYGQQIITGNQLYSISTKVLNYKDATLIEDTEFTLKDCGVFVHVNQYSISETEYNYWEAVSDQFENKNYIFGQTENQAIGNIKCTSDENIIALGYFGASAIKSKIGAFSLTEKNKLTHSYDVSSHADEIEMIINTDTITIYETAPRFAVPFAY